MFSVKWEIWEWRQQLLLSIGSKQSSKGNSTGLTCFQRILTSRHGRLIIASMMLTDSVIHLTLLVRFYTVSVPSKWLNCLSHLRAIFAHGFSSFFALLFVFCWYCFSCSCPAHWPFSDSSKLIWNYWSKLIKHTKMSLSMDMWLAWTKDWLDNNNNLSVRDLLLK